MTTVSAYSYTHSVTYVADNVLKSLKDIIRLSGMDPTKLTNQWESTHLAIKTWLASEHLQQVVLEIYAPSTNTLLLRWDVDIAYQWSGSDGAFYTDTDQLRYNIKKAGVAPSSASYDILLKTRPNRPDVVGWGSGAFRATDGMVRQCLGSTIEHSGLGANSAYWRPV
jgi:Bacterial HORMA domain 2